MEQFNANGILFAKGDEKYIDINEIQDIRDVFKDCVVHTCHLSKFHKVYYIMEDIQEQGVAHIVYGEEGNDYLPDRLLCVFCDDVKPIQMTEEAKQEFKSKLGV